MRSERESDMDLLDTARFAKRPVLTARIAAARLQQRLSAMLQGGMERNAGTLCAAFLLGDRSAVDGEISLQFRRSGVSHLLALSGMHLGIIVAILTVLLRRVRLPRNVQSMLVCAAAVAYLFLTGCAVSTTRATIMLLLLYGARFVGREADGLTSLSLFFAACVAWEPYMLMDSSLWLTSLAAAVPVAIIPALQRRREDNEEGGRVSGRRIQRMLEPLAISLLCTLVLLIPMWMSFGEMSLLSPLTTLILSVPVTALLLLGMMWLLLLPFSMLPAAQFWCGYLLAGMEWLAEVMLDVVAYGASLPHTMLSLRYASLNIVMPLLAVCLVTCALYKLTRRYMAALVAASMLLGGVAMSYAGTSQVASGVEHSLSHKVRDYS